jgi:TfoX/Sxy family transcriptional regulator of competence genes
MAYDEPLAERVRRVLAGRPGLEERRMFGGLAFLLDGRMFCGISKDELMVRVGPERHAEALAAPHARPMDFTGRPMKGMVFVGAAGLRGPALRRWVERGVEGLATPAPRARARGGASPPPSARQARTSRKKTSRGTRRSPPSGTPHVA